MRTETATERDGQGVVSWRCKQLATDPRYDLHALIELVERGCLPEFAVRILAPLEETAA